MPAMLVAVMAVLLSATPADPPLEAAAAARFATLALDCAFREYPNKIAHVLSGEEDVRAPHVLTPAFYGCYDWHSAVHGHWLLARLLRTFPTAPFAAPARAALARSLTPANVAGEVAYVQGKGRTTFERPYGLAWLLQLAAELREWDDADARGWSAALAPLEAEAALRFEQWLPKLTRPIRVGEHDQTAFAFGLVLDWVAVSDRATTREMVRGRAREFYLADRACPMAYEPSGQDFLSPCLAEADLVRRLLPPARYAGWLSAFLPTLTPRTGVDWLRPAVVTDPSDPKLAHLDGLNLSRAWMLEGIASGLPASDPRLAAVRALARAHREAGLASVTGAHYEGGHWLGTFAVYLATQRGLRPLDRASARP
jgi:DUF2891 family protein